MTTARAFAIAFLVLVAGTGSAEGRGFDRVPAAVAVVTDGAGLAAWKAGPRLHLLRDGARTAESRPIDALVDCTLAAAGAGKAVFDCPGEHAFNPVLYDIPTGAIAPPAGADDLGAFADANQANSEHYFTQAIGHALMRFRIVGNHVSTTGLLNWRSGELLEPPRRSTRTIATLDLPGGLAPVCRPLRVSRHTEYDFLGDPYPVFDPASLRRGRLLIHHLGRVVLRRCGSGRTRVLARKIVLAPLLTARYAAWISGERVHAFIFRSRRHLSWSLPIPRRNAPTLRATDRRLFVTNWKRSYAICCSSEAASAEAASTERRSLAPGDASACSEVSENRSFRSPRA